MRRRTLLTFVLGLLVACVWAGSAQAATTTWNIKVTNLTTGQPFSPPLWSVDKGTEHMWQLNHLATAGFSLIAEDAFNDPLLAFLQSDGDVGSAGTALPPVTNPVTPAPIAPGGTREWTIQTKGKFTHFSVAWMLVRTNDGFSGVDSINLGDRPGKRKHGKRGKPRKATNQNLLLQAYDAGTEKNNENGAFIPGPPFNHKFVRDPEAQVITLHPGITGGDLTPYKWTGPVARIEITRAP